MAIKQSKSVRKLVTLPPDLADRVEKFRQSSEASSESDALKLLIEAGLRTRDSREDLFQRCQAISRTNQNILEFLISLADHPLVASTYLDNESIVVYLKMSIGENSERFFYGKKSREWSWEEKDKIGNWGEKFPF